MQPILLIDVDSMIAVAQCEDDAGVQSHCGPGRDNRMHAIRHVSKVAIGFDIVQQVHAEVIQAEVGDGHTRFKVFQFDHLFLESPELLLAIRNFAAFCREDVVIAGGRHISNNHAVFDPFLEVNVFIQGNIGPVVHQLDGLVDGADTVDPAEPLNDANRVPVDVIVDQVIAVLKVLPFGDTVGANKQVQFS